MAAQQAGQGPLLGWDIIEIHPESDRAVIGVRPGRDVLMPFNNFTCARPFVVELRTVEFDVRTDQIGGDVGQHRFPGKPPEIRMPIDQCAQPADMRPVRSVLRAKVECLV
jgi:hypothetical protein